MLYLLEILRWVVSDGLSLINNNDEAALTITQVQTWWNGESKLFLF